MSYKDRATCSINIESTTATHGTIEIALAYYSVTVSGERDYGKRNKFFVSISTPKTAHSIRYFGTLESAHRAYSGATSYLNSEHGEYSTSHDVWARVLDTLEQDR